MQPRVKRNPSTSISLKGDIMNKNTIILIIVVLVIGVLIGYFVLPILVKSAATTGENVFGSSSGITPPTMP